MDEIDPCLQKQDVRKLRKQQWEAKWSRTDGLQKRMVRSNMWVTENSEQGVSWKDHNKMPSRLLNVFHKKDELGNRRVYLATNAVVHFTPAHYKRTKEMNSNKAQCKKASMPTGFEQYPCTRG
eukprot:TRINITY_DN4321_c0_g3_i2.p1 TRINITY_DN4321_c0_g3~~TRINITY_DN4321_c0_g3_i2.p1  ORF type:complete len:123 (+),score=30.09 TRINITY_DN4321_c0_g3_i2:47-415(+)